MHNDISLQESLANSCKLYLEKIKEKRHTKHFSLVDFLITSCGFYFDYLVKLQKGREYFPLITFLPNEKLHQITFVFEKKITSPDFLIIKIFDQEIFLNHEDILDKNYNERNRSLNLELEPHLFEQICESKKSEKLSFYNDLKFLIKNLETFFQNRKDNGDFIALPKKSLFFPPALSNISLLIPEKGKITKEQREAVNGILNHSLSYIWGPPGSGKTQFVLLEALNYYLEKNQKVCVLAPTNNALEQILQTLIQRFDLLGIRRNKILRLGMPTTHFINNFAEVCDPFIIKQKNKTTLFTSQSSPKQRYEEAIIFGMTIDGFIKKYDILNINFAHFFLDECAYTPLIKTLALCIKNTPITLIGDHKQLQPICEMGERQIKDKLEITNLWKFSSLYLEIFFNNPCFYENLNLSFDPRKNLEQTKYFSLTTSYRYGQNLAKILDNHIYQNNLQGNKDKNTEIYYIDTQESSSNGKTSENEANLVLKIYKELEREDIAILTPFKDQRAKIIKKGIPSQKVMTIHSSQGREFDTIILSPVKLSHHLTDSNNPDALYTLNVAISRLKEKLIIVCNYNFWMRQKNQFLCKILEQAKPYKFKL